MIKSSALSLVLYFLLQALITKHVLGRSNARSYTDDDLNRLKGEVSKMFHRAYQGYLDHAYPYDELRPLTCSGMDTWGSYSLTLIDALDTLAVMGNHTEFRRVYNLLSESKNNFDANINVSVFETNIRIVGGLLAAHLMAKRCGVDIEPGWPCNGPLLRLAEDVASRLLPAFDTETGMPYGTVNLRHGVPKGETPITCTAGVGTYIIEFGTLSRLTGNPVFEETAMRALKALWHSRSSIGLVGNHIDVQTGKWTATDAGIGAGVDSYFEYLVKGSSLLQRPELIHMFKESRSAIEQYLNHDDWYFWVNMKQGGVTMPVFQSLEAFWPGILSLVGDTQSAMKSIHNYYQVWKQYGFLPEFYNVAQGAVASKREGYPLRPELIESAMYLYRATKDPFLLTIGEDMLKSIEHSSRTKCGYATVKDVRDHALEDRMESFFLAETTKYLYLLFDKDNFIHNTGNTATVLQTPYGECVIDAGGYVFNTEAHPIDPAALQCCSGHTEADIRQFVTRHLVDIAVGDDSPLNALFEEEFKGDTLSTRMKQIQQQKANEEARRLRDKLKYERKMEEERAKEREILKKRMTAELNKKQQSEQKKNEHELHKTSEKPVNSTPEESIVVNENFDSEQTNNLEKSNVREIKESKNEDEISKLEIEVGLEESSNENDAAGLDSDNSPSFPKKSDGSDSVVNDESSKFNPNVLIHRQSKDFAATSVDLKDRVVQDDKLSATSDETIEHTKENNENTNHNKIETSKISEQYSPPSKPAKIDAFFLLNKFNSIVKEYLGSPKSLVGSSKDEFDLDEFHRKVMSDKRFELNKTWYEDYFIMSCPAKNFVERFAVQGEIFDKQV